MGNREAGSFKLPEWVVKWVMGSGLITSLFTFGAHLYLDVGILKKEIDWLKAEVAQNRSETRVIESKQDERDRKAISKIDEVLDLMQRNQRRR